MAFLIVRCYKYVRLADQSPSSDVCVTANAEGSLSKMDLYIYRAVCMYLVQLLYCKKKG